MDKRPPEPVKAPVKAVPPPVPIVAHAVCKRGGEYVLYRFDILGDRVVTRAMVDQPNYLRIVEIQGAEALVDHAQQGTP